MDTKCVKQELMSYEVVDLKTKGVIDNDWYLLLHRHVNAGLCLSGLFLTLLLSIVVIKCPSNMQKMKPILWFGITVDILVSIINFVSCAFPDINNDKFIAITNGPFEIKSWLVNGIIMALVGWITIISWITVPCQFIFRYYLIKFGHPPKGCALFIFVFTVLFILIFSMALAIFYYTTPNSREFNDEALEILSHYGLSIPSYKMHGAAMNSMRFQIYNNYLTVIVFVSYLIVIYCAVIIRSYLKTACISSKTKRLNADMDKVLITLAITPIFNSIYPGIYQYYFIRRCEYFIFISVASSWLLVIAPIVNSCLTIYFIQPYRRLLKKWMLFTPATPSSIGYTTNSSLSHSIPNDQIFPSNKICILSSI